MKEMVCIHKGPWKWKTFNNKLSGSDEDGPKFNELVIVCDIDPYPDSWFVVGYSERLNDLGGHTYYQKKWFADILPSESLTALLEETKPVEA